MTTTTEKPHVLRARVPRETKMAAFATRADMVRLFSKTVLTIDSWRQTKGMPYILITGGVRDTVRFNVPAVLKWAAKEGKAVNQTVLKELESRR